MSLDSRSTRSALFKRAEQLKRWQESDTNREPSAINGDNRRIKFSAGCVFLAACAAGDKDEVLSLLKKGADIDTANVDGLSALHQVNIYVLLPHPLTLRLSIFPSIILLYLHLFKPVTISVY